MTLDEALKFFDNDALVYFKAFGNFMEERYKALEEDASSLHPLERLTHIGTGLCANWIMWCGKQKANLTSEEHNLFAALMNQMHRENEDDEIYMAPFNDFDGEKYVDEMHAKACHLNPKRIAFVRALCEIRT